MRKLDEAIKLNKLVTVWPAINEAPSYEIKSLLKLAAEWPNAKASE